ncbi:5-oxoprolinase subunit B family protein [Marmoricola sp. RAF53]|uniref:5-oxoprolinase subunit B family protein n=1 Tax=Marmoricola sp. RAF53 TaxID=3233059 RepID=UPI003F987B1B
MRARAVGEHAVLVRCADDDEVRATYAVLRGAAAELGAVEVVPAARTVLLDGIADPEALVARLDAWHAPPVGALATAPEVTVPVRYDGPDLEVVAEQWGTSAAEVVRLHQQSTFTVAFCGFAPGFAYCTGLPDGLTVRRRDEPRPMVPAGSVALAGEYTGIYPTSSPGGWQLIGTTDAVLWRPEADPPALLAPGTRVGFRDASSLGSSTQGFRDA